MHWELEKKIAWKKTRLMSFSSIFIKAWTNQFGACRGEINIYAAYLKKTEKCFQPAENLSIIISLWLISLFWIWFIYIIEAIYSLWVIQDNVADTQPEETNVVLKDQLLNHCSCSNTTFIRGQGFLPAKGWTFLNWLNKADRDSEIVLGHSADPKLPIFHTT